MKSKNCFQKPLLSNSSCTATPSAAGVGAGAGAEDEDPAGVGGVANVKSLGVMRTAIFPWLLVLLGCFTMVAGTIANVVDAVRGRAGPGGR
jgi:hypothetical protein